MDLETKRIDTYISLEPTVQKLYSSPEAGKYFSDIFEKFNLSESVYTQYIHIIGDAILGFYKTNEIPQKLQTELGMSADDAQRIMSDLSDFLAPVIERERAAQEPNRDGLKELQQNFQSLREEALQTSNQQAVREEVLTPQAAAPENLPTGTPDIPAPAAATEIPAAPTAPTSEEVPTIQVPKAVTKTSYTVEPMRTMGGDVTRVHGYGAYRDLFPEEAGEQEYKEEVIKSASQEDILQEKPQLTEKPTYGDA